MRRSVTVILGMMVLGASAQTEVTDGHLPAMSIDTLHLEKPELLPQLSTPSTMLPALPDAQSNLMQQHVPIDTRDGSFVATKEPSLPTTDFILWKGASLTINGMQQAMPGMMGINAGNVTLHQDFGRLHFTASGLANKYWMPGINSMMGMPMLHTQWGFSGTLSYDVSPALKLHAFGTYYATNPIVRPAMSPYINTTKFGGFADIRINVRFGSYIGAEHYLNPMTGKWDTDPIVTPYINVGRNKKSRIEFPVGSLLKAAFFGNRNDPKRWQAPPPPSR